MNADDLLARLLDPATWKSLLDGFNKFESVYGQGHFRMKDIDLLRDFLRTVSHEEDLVAVLRGHLMVDVQLNELLAQHLGGSGVLSFVSFQDKVILTKRHHLIPKEYRRLLLAVNDLRNSFAHPPVKTVLTNNDAAELYEAVPTEFHKVLIAYHGADAQAGEQVRAILGFTFSWLHGQVDAAIMSGVLPPNLLQAKESPTGESLMNPGV